MKTSFKKLLAAQVVKQQGHPLRFQSTKLRNTALVAAFIIVLTSLASADIYQDLTTTLYYPSCIMNGECIVNPGGSGSMAYGSATFTDLPPNYPPWSYSFATGLAFNWSYDVHQGYYALFDSGTFDMNGPYSLTFSGTISRASASQSGAFTGETEVDVWFSGYWSNGVYGSGVAYIQQQGAFGNAFLQTKAEAPEPSSLIMLGSGVVGVAGMLRARILTRSRQVAFSAINS